MRAASVRGLLIYCSDYRCSYSIAISGDPWEDDVRLSDIEPRFTCRACGRKGADVRPNFDWELEERRAKTRAAAITDDGWVAGYSVKAAKTNGPINVATPTVITARKNLAIPAPTSAPKS